MKKTLYSLMLNDEVVREVDALAHRMGTVLRKRVGIAAAAQAELDGEQRGAAEQAEHQPCDRQRCRAEAACEYAEHGGYGGERQRADVDS